MTCLAAMDGHRLAASAVVLGDEELHGVLAEHWSTATGEQWVGRSAASLREPDAECRDAMSRERRDGSLRPLP